MGRPPVFTEERILDAATRVIASEGPGAGTVTSIAAALGAPSGSIYHRFASRDVLMAQLWIRVVRSAQVGFVEALSGDAPSTLDAALHLPRWSRQHPAEARIATAFRREELAAQWPAELGDELRALNQSVADALASHSEFLFGDAEAEHLQLTSFALVDVPHAAVRRHLLAGRRPPTSVDGHVTTTTRCLLPIR